jgi:hypothetical protein
MESPTYCKGCFAAIAAEELPEDTARLHELDHYWAMQSELKHTMGIALWKGWRGGLS